MHASDRAGISFTDEKCTC